MKQLWYRIQFFLVMLFLAATMVLAYLVIHRVDWHYDVTQGKVHSLPEETARVLRELSKQPLEILAFYPKDDSAREELTVFLRLCHAAHPQLQFNIYDPLRRPKLAEQYHIEQNATTVIRAGEREERIYSFTEESFTNALFRLAHPRKMNVCFVTGHQELDLKNTQAGGVAMLVKNLQTGDVQVHSIVLSREGVPDACTVTVMAGPHTEPSADEFEKLRVAFQKGKGLFFLIDPMDLGVGGKFVDFFKSFGVIIGGNVLVDKASRIAGGDMLMPAITNFTKHEALKQINKTEPVFFPVARTVQPYYEISKELEVSPLALTGEGSWAESDLAALENGKAIFDPKHDIAGPLPIAVAVETHDPKGGRMIIVGDSDFVTNGYANISQNLDLALEFFKWLGRDSRFIHVRAHHTPFKPLIMKERERQYLLIMILAVYPLALFIPVGIYLLIRSKTS